MKKYFIAFAACAALMSCGRDAQVETPEQIAQQYQFADTAILQVARADADAIISKDPADPSLEGDLLAIRAKEQHIRQAGLEQTADLYITAIEKHVQQHAPELAVAMGL